MKERFPLGRTVKRIVAVENVLNEWIERYQFETSEIDILDGAGRYHDRLEHLVAACANLQDAAFELEHIKRP